MATEKLVDLTGETLNRLRQIRRGVVDTNPLNFEGQPRSDAERLIDGFADMVIANGSKNGQFEKRQMDLLEETEQSWGGNRPYYSSGTTRPEYVLILAQEVVKQAAKVGNPWNPILENNWADCTWRPGGNDLVITALSTGAMVARVAQKLDINNPKLALVATRFDRPGWRGELRKTGEAYLPKMSSWPNTEFKSASGGVYRLIDETVITATTLNEIEKKLVESGVNKNLIVK